MTFWELDVKDMFPSLDRTSVYDAIIFIHDALWEKLVNARKARGKCMVFFINRFDKHTGEETSRILLEEWFCVYGAPKEINSDKDVRVRSDTGWYKRVLRSLNVQVSTGTPYTHTNNPLCERQIVSAASPICSDFLTFCPDWLHFGHFLCFGGIPASQLSLRIFPIYF